MTWMCFWKLFLLAFSAVCLLWLTIVTEKGPKNFTSQHFSQTVSDLYFATEKETWAFGPHILKLEISIKERSYSWWWCWWCPNITTWHFPKQHSQRSVCRWHLPWLAVNRWSWNNLQLIRAIIVIITSAAHKTFILSDDHEKQTILLSQEQMSTPLIQKWMDIDSRANTCSIQRLDLQKYDTLNNQL